MIVGSGEIGLACDCGRVENGGIRGDDNMQGNLFFEMGGACREKSVII